MEIDSAEAIAFWVDFAVQNSNQQIDCGRCRLGFAVFSGIWVCDFCDGEGYYEVAGKKNNMRYKQSYLEKTKKGKRM